MTLLPGTLLSHYRLVEKIGEGGMGIVYRAEDTRLRREVALKVLPSELVANEERRLRFLREARTAAAVNHPNIATIHEIDEADGVVFITMELVEGKTLREQMGGKALPMKDTLRIATEMSEGLARAHQAHVIHRDLKPDNIMVDPDGHVKILDFGLAKLHEDLDEVRRSELSRLETVSGEMTREGKVLGTPAYMSPEQARGKPVDARSDLFAFGITLYEMVTGKLPFKGRTTTDTLSAITRDEPIPPSEINADVSPEMERIIGKCLEKDSSDRYQHADELAVDLRHMKRAADPAVQRVVTPSAPIEIRATVRRRRNRWALSACAVLVLIAAAIGGWRFFRPEVRFKSGDQIIVADFQNGTGRVEFDTAIRDVFEDMLSQSMFLMVIRGDQLEGMARKESIAPGARLDRDLAIRLCADKNCSGFVTGRIDAAGDAYQVQVTLHSTQTKEPAIQLSATALSSREILRTVHDLTLDLRRKLGEAPRSISGTFPPTTESILAYQTYVIGRRIADNSPDEAVSLYNQALRQDPRFVSAYSALASAHFNLRNLTEAREAAEQAYRHSSDLSEQLRLITEIIYVDSIHDYDREIRLLKRYMRLYPFDATAPNYLAWIYLHFQDFPTARKYQQAAYDTDPIDAHHWSLCMILAAQGLADELDQLVSDHRTRGGSELAAGEGRLWAAVARGGAPAVLHAIEALEARQIMPASRGLAWRLYALLAIGHLREAQREASAVCREADTVGSIRVGFPACLAQSWLDARHTNRRGSLSEKPLESALTNLLFLDDLAVLSVEIDLEKPLERAIAEHERVEKKSNSRYVLEEIQFARGCLALVRNKTNKAMKLIEPLTRNSLRTIHHHVLARIYEDRELWQEAAREYEEAVSDLPHIVWIPTSVFNPAIHILDQFRLARIYDRLNDTHRAGHWYERFVEDWKDADPDIPELIEARKRLEQMKGEKILLSAEQDRVN